MVELSIVIPAHNEESRILDCLERVSRKFGRAEVIVSEDGSTDGTVEMVESFSRKRPNVRLLKNRERLGKGGGLIAGLTAARGGKIVFMDADCSVDPSEIPALVKALEHADVATGSRAIRGARILVQPPVSRRIAGRAFNILVNLLFGLRSSDTQCGFKAMRRPAVRKIIPGLVSRGFEVDVEILARARNAGLRVAEVPVDWSYKSGSKVDVVRESVSMLAGILRIWWVLRNEKAGIR